MSIKINYYFSCNFLYYKIYIIIKTFIINKTNIINQIPCYNNTIKNNCINYISNSLYLNINLYINVNLQPNTSISIKININSITRSQFLIKLLLFDNTWKNFYNLINYTKIKTNVKRQKITSHLNQVFFIISANLLVHF